ncbi:NAD-dependent epimerase/dehydratase family protein [Iodobacter ciconiae]|uniref:NAD-dependent epimerase/dehydratase family protein n=1 Tax=Iodobacter ciconiae TaxID=2496266 RepID=A0A3S8ZQN6_9NEIS|nr:NAD-dependent epimerase/dehydratase family protein [Iodobacter ciconiae]AZN35787.1 NAD-dependent epimerase/dehydratase family protein [Iodobacter ciconiae]
MDEQLFLGKKVLITGGMGFIGSNLAIRLVGLGAEVSLVDSLIPEYGGNVWNIESIKKQVRVNISDVRDPYSMKYLIQGQDYLFNLAGQTSHIDSMHNPFVDLDINAQSQLSILESCRHHNPDVKVVFASTRQLYGAPQYLPVDEKHPLNPVDVNGINKMAGEGYHLLYNQVYGIRSVVLRLTNTYGPRMRVKDARQTFLGIWIKKIICGEPFQIFGDGLQLRDFNYVDDVVEAMLISALSEEANGQVFNLGDHRPLNLNALADCLCHLDDLARFELVPFPAERKAIDIGDYYANYNLIKDKLGWVPFHSLDSGLAETLSFYREFGAHYWS